MVELLLLMLGTRLVRRSWWVLALIGLVWFIFGAFFLLDALVDEIRIPAAFFTVPLFLDAAISLLAIRLVILPGAGRMLRLVRAILFSGVALLIILAPHHSGMFIGILVGTYLIGDAIWRAASAYIVRYSGWRISIFNACIEFVLGLWSLLPWPTNWQGEVGSDVGTLLMVTAVGMIGLALRIRHMAPDMPISTILSRGWPKTPWESVFSSGEEAEDPAAPGRQEVATVHVWTPTGRLASINRAVERYIAAVDQTGVISTGHAALELQPDVYISHYPAVEIDRSPEDFRRILQATAENDVQGRFQPSYAIESADWCPSSFQVRMVGLNAEALRAFWARYRADDTYNLTDRNCSSAVAKALDAGLDGLLEGRRLPLGLCIQLMLRSELWIAGMLRRRAAAMAWTPGLVLDYSRALTQILALVNAFPLRTEAKEGHRPFFTR